MDPELSEEFDTGVEQDEILAGGGHYAVGVVPGTTWKALVLIGAVVTVFGIVLQYLVTTGSFGLAEYYPTPLGSALVLAVLVAGVLILLLGVGLALRSRRDPPIEPIV